MRTPDKLIDKYSRFMMLVGVVWFIFCAVAFSNAGFNILLMLVALPVVVIWTLFWLIRMFISFRRRQGECNVKTHCAYYLIEPALMVVPLLLAYLGVFSSVRFMLSEPALLSYVESVRAGKVELAVEFNHAPRHIGLYTITYTDLIPDGTVRVLTSSHGVMDRAGFAHSPQNPPPRRGEDFYKHIHQQWWIWYESW